MVKAMKNIMLILSSPSGVGKTTLTKKIQQKYSSFKISVSEAEKILTVGDAVNFIAGKAN
jgi:guanylate kinase